MKRFNAWKVAVLLALLLFALAPAPAPAETILFPPPMFGETNDGYLDRLGGGDHQYLYTDGINWYLVVMTPGGYPNHHTYGAPYWMAEYWEEVVGGVVVDWGYDVWYSHDGVGWSYCCTF
jgi:hypothetical protein